MPVVRKNGSVGIDVRNHNHRGEEDPWLRADGDEKYGGLLETLSVQLGKLPDKVEGDRRAEARCQAHRLKFKRFLSVMVNDGESLRRLNGLSHLRYRLKHSRKGRSRSTARCLSP